MDGGGSSSSSRRTVAGVPQDALVWLAFFMLVFLVWMFCSSGDFSFLLTLSALMRMFGIGVLNFKVWGENSVKGVSVKTFTLYASVFFFRLLSIFRHQGYLPYDKSGDWMYHFIEVCSLLMTLLVVYAAMGPLRATYQERLDIFGNWQVASEFGAVWLFFPCMLLAILYHPSMNREFFSDTMWTWSMYLESVAMLPQLYMFIRSASASAEGGGTIIDTNISHTVAALSISRVFEMVFWLWSYQELIGETGSYASGYLVLITQLIHLLIMSDFMYHYVTALYRGQQMELPLHQETVFDRML